MKAQAPCLAIDLEAKRPCRYWGAALFAISAASWLATIAAARLLATLI
jgi:hypothetical protein